MTNIASRAFFEASNLKSINLSNVISLTNGANFKNATSLNIVVDMPNLTGVIPYGAFENTAIEGIESLGTITSIQGNVNVNAGGGWGNHAAFRNCANLKYIKLPSSLKEIQYAAFAACTQLSSIIFEDKNSITTIGNSAFVDVPAEIEVDFPNLTGTLGFASFQNTGIKEVKNLGKITVISGTKDGQGHSGWGSWGAFKNCVNLTSVIFPETISAIQYHAFYNCTSLVIEDLSLPNLETLGQNAFYGVSIKKISNLGKITALPAANTTTLNLGNRSTLEEVTLPYTLSIIPDYFFYKYSKIRAINLEHVETIGVCTFEESLDGVEVNMANLQSITGNKAFYKCGAVLLDFTGSTFTETKDSFAQGSTRLEKIVLPSTLTTIGYYAFSGCTSLNEVIVHTATPPTMSGNIFTSTNSTFTIYVPDASVTAYKEASGWVDYADRIKPISEMN